MLYLALMNRSDQKLIAINTLQVREKNSGKILIKVPGLDIQAGQILGIKGPSGIGKSVLMRTLALLTTLEKALEVSGKLLLKYNSGQWIDLLSVSTDRANKIRRECIGMILQEPLASFPPGRTINHILNDVLKDNNLYTASSQTKIKEELILKVGLDKTKDILLRYPEELSGGQLQRVAIACCLAKNSKIILADEPTSSLDTIQKVNFINLVKEIQRNEGLTWILASHDDSLLNALCDNIFIMSDTKNESVNVIRDEIQSTFLKTSDEQPAEFLELKNLSYGFKQPQEKIQALRNINCHIKLNTITAICGPSGCGKTTLAKIISGFYHNYTGQICFKKKHVKEMTQEQYVLYQRKIQYMHQDAWDAFNPAYSAKQILVQACKDAGISAKSIYSVIHSISEQCLLKSELLDSYPYQLSGGERQRLHLARCLIFEPELLILDEPMSGLATAQSQQLYRLLLRLIDQKKTTILWITHNIEEIKWVSENLIVMWDGQIAELGPTKQILKNPTSDATKQLNQASIF
jgi:peptide/nickel transport system ATP-binding protein